MEDELLKQIQKQIAALKSPASFVAIESTIEEQRNRLREELREELRRSLNFQHVKLHPDLKKHHFTLSEKNKDAIASLIADLMIQDGCPTNEQPVIKIEPAIFLSPSQSLQDSAVVVLHFADGKKQHRSVSFRYK